MARGRSENTDRQHLRIDDRLIQCVWDNARVIPEVDPEDWRQDECGAWIRRDQYDHRDSDFGWKILDVVADHRNEPGTLRAFHVLNSFQVEQGRAVCRVRADREHLPAGSRIVGEPCNTKLAD